MTKLLLVVLFACILNAKVYAKAFSGVRDDIKELNNTLIEYMPIVGKLSEGIFCLSHPGNRECIKNGGIMSSSPSR